MLCIYLLYSILIYVIYACIHRYTILYYDGYVNMIYVNIDIVYYALANKNVANYDFGLGQSNQGQAHFGDNPFWRSMATSQLMHSRSEFVSIPQIA